MFGLGYVHILHSTASVRKDRHIYAHANNTSTGMNGRLALTAILASLVFIGGCNDCDNSDALVWKNPDGEFALRVRALAAGIMGLPTVKEQRVADSVVFGVSMGYTCAQCWAKYVLCSAKACAQECLYGAGMSEKGCLYCNKNNCSEPLISCVSPAASPTIWGGKR